MAFLVELIKERPTYLRLDVLPFILLYAIIYQATQTFQEGIFGDIAFVLAFLVHCVFYLMNHWSQRLQRKIKYFNTQNIENCKQIYFTYEKKDKPNLYEICQLIKQDGELSFQFQKKKYIYNQKTKSFSKLKIELEKNVQFYFKKQIFEQAKEKYAQNILDIPLRSFKNLLQDQMLEPFTFFQFFSIGLWLLDENRIYCVFTLIMVGMTACANVLQRLRTLLMLRSMRLQPSLITVYRENKWINVSSESLLPGDICKIQPGSQNQACDSFDKRDNTQVLKDMIPFSQYLPTKFFQTENNQQNNSSFKFLACDMILLSGTCVVNEAMLTGESSPQIKDSLYLKYKDDKSEPLNLKNLHKNCILYCGTEILQTFEDETLPENIEQTGRVSGCYGQYFNFRYVMKTGFQTQKGKLIRTVLYNTNTVKNTDGFILIFILLIFSMMSSGYVLYHGLQDPNRSRQKLLIRCITIVTTVVPPELPMIISISVNFSQKYLQSKNIFCTEPNRQNFYFRIPLVGSVGVCAFDKTGTLTSDKLNLRGAINAVGEYLSFEEFDNTILSVLSGCHSLIYHEKHILGDPIEKLFFEKGTFQYTHKLAKSKSGLQQNAIQKIFPFSSDLKRMSVISNWISKTENIDELRVLSKGAPEFILPLLKYAPENYQMVFEKYTKQGFRVLALAYKILPKNIDTRSIQRNEIEKDLIFAGFYICESPLKPDTKRHIDSLIKANFQVIMITGDNQLVAANISKQLQLAKGKTLELCIQGENLIWVDETKKTICKFGEQIPENDPLLCLDGQQMKNIIQSNYKQSLDKNIQKIKVFSRTSPAQKEYVINCYNVRFLKKELGINTLMCGDGTNDVSALKKSDIGVALVGCADESQIKEKKNSQKAEEKKYKAQEQERIQKLRQCQSMQEYREKLKEIQTDRMKHHKEQKLDFESLLEDVQIGDACIAAPFTIKYTGSIKGVILILRQGLCTLQTSLFTYKILTLQSFMCAYSMSILNIEALKFSEYQLLLLGITGSAYYYFFTSGKIVKELPSHKPDKTIFCWYFMSSLIFQLILHIYTMDYIYRFIAKPYTVPGDTNDSQFTPTIFNTIIFIYNLFNQTCIFMFNYGGLPFMKPLTENKNYFKWLIIPFILVYALTANISELNYIFELQFEGFLEEDRTLLLQILMVVGFLNYFVERLLKWLKYGEILDFI